MLLGTNDKSSRVFELMYLLYQQKLRRFFLHKTKRNIPESEDLVHETLIKVNQAISRGLYKDNNKPFAWVMRIAHNLFIDSKRREKKSLILQSLDYKTGANPVKNSSSENLSWLDQTISREMFDLIKAALKQLPPEQREVIIMHYFLGMKFKEIAEITEVSIFTSIGRARYALIRLRKILK